MLSQTEKDKHYQCLSYVEYIKKKYEQNKPEQAYRYRAQSTGYQRRRRGWEEGKVGKWYQLFGDARILNFGSEHWRVYRNLNIILYKIKF